MSETRVVDYEPARRDELLGLLERVRGHETEPRELEWWFDGNPVKPRLVLLAEIDGALAGVLGASLYRSVVDGVETIAALPLWAATDEAFRGRGIFQALNRALEARVRAAGATVELGFTNRLAGPIYVSRLGWSDVDRLRLWARLLRPGRRASALRGSGDFERFGSAQEQAYRAAAPAYRSHFVRDAAYLNWRYADATRPYLLLASGSGYAVLGAKPHGNLFVAVVADLVAPPDAFQETRALLRRCARAARGADLLLAFMPPTRAQRLAFLAAGFVPTPTAFRLIGKGLEGRLPLGGDAWHFTPGDTDFF